MLRKICFLVVVPALLASPAASQLVSERIDGVRRTCVYAGSGGGNIGARAHRVGLGESCPSTPPPPLTNFAAPPSATLISDIPGGEVRRCVYEQANQQWAFDIPLQRTCPFAAGMIPAQQDERIRR